MICSPTRVPPPSLEKTLRPSSASWPSERVEGEHGHHVAHRRGRHDHLVAAGLQRHRRRRPVEPAPHLLLHLLERGRDRRLADPGRPRPVRRAPDQADRPGRLRMGEPQPGRAAEIQGGQVLLREAGQHRVAGPGPPEGAGQRAEHALERAGVRLLRVESEVTGGPRVGDLDEGEGVLGRGAPPGVGQGRRRHVGHAVRAHHPGPPRRADRRARQRDHADRAPALDAVGRRRVQGEADVDVAGLLDQHDAAVGPTGVRRGQPALHELLGRDHPPTADTLNGPTPRAC